MFLSVTDSETLFMLLVSCMNINVILSTFVEDVGKFIQRYSSYLPLRFCLSNDYFIRYGLFYKNLYLEGIQKPERYNPP